ncbi:dihydroxyacetone kinase subunit DhaL [Pullulanibacillus sp. KACC 23026]|uniref:dihydroxyacetone kinase subunit DhaL n=1 Tax=Pullulanibacillus sp. KACC 23026 TaxID=3028315 RepID=UPI0023AF3824|nr:dihydroxyacetone kinase subunit DhaL [Pullulanibacillus sp. KACC 23026]WEG13320.1 dihydroxyacetone kinase subunit DhaL [Pullulanibacillus sp. KACC 23026]
MMLIQEWKDAVVHALQLVVDHETYLDDLDKSLGDGDHGTTVARGMRSAIKGLEEECEYGNQVFAIVGNRMLEAMGGASGVLYGVFFRASRKCSKQSEMTPEYILELFETGLQELKKRSGANLGDKTMLDAVVPAVEAVRSAVKDGETDVRNTLRLALEGAKQGAESTKDMLARFGRAKFLGERSRSIMDPGAASFTLFFEGLYSGAAVQKIGDAE